MILFRKARERPQKGVAVDAGTSDLPTYDTRRMVRRCN